MTIIAESKRRRNPSAFTSKTSFDSRTIPSVQGHGFPLKVPSTTSISLFPPPYFEPYIPTSSNARHVVPPGQDIGRLATNRSSFPQERRPFQAPGLPERPRKPNRAERPLQILPGGRPDIAPQAMAENSPLRNTENSGPGIALAELISTKFNAVITSIDGESFSGDERELRLVSDSISYVQEDTETLPDIYQHPGLLMRGGWGSANTARELSRSADKTMTSVLNSANYFAKANLYNNSKLPLHLPPLQLYLQGYRMICLAAQYSQRVYSKPLEAEREIHVEADWRTRTKAMVLKSVPVDNANTIIFAIRGSQSFMDWAVNLNTAPISPEGFLDDSGNLCHSGFLSVARKMITPVAARLRSLLEEDPSRASSSLVMCGHSAGGAVASLLFVHMLAENAKSELNGLSDCFKSIHCLTFGAPPISLLPLTKPSNPRHSKSLFFSFINEGDPVPRADKAYVRSLIDLYVSPAPKLSPPPPAKPCKLLSLKPCRNVMTNSNNGVAPLLPASGPIWPIPPGTLSNAGRLVVLRQSLGGARDSNEDISAQITYDQELRGVIFGNPVMHMMSVYKRRVELLATRAVTGLSWA